MSEFEHIKNARKLMADLFGAAELKVDRTGINREPSNTPQKTFNEKKPMTFGSLFSGIGGIDLGLERSGMTCRWQVEINPYCQRILNRHWPTVPKYYNIRNVGQELEPVDLIAGGFPCQDVSIVGNRKGIAGEKSGLWREFAHIVRLLRPRYVLVENVRGLLSRGFARGRQEEPGFGSCSRERNPWEIEPEWVERLMGFPTGWTELKPLETQSCPKSRSGSGDK